MQPANGQPLPLGARLAAARRREQLTQGALATILGVGIVTARRWEHAGPVEKMTTANLSRCEQWLESIGLGITTTDPKRWTSPLHVCIAIARRRKRLTQHQLARILGVDRHTLNNWEQGQPITLTTSTLICERWLESIGFADPVDDPKAPLPIRLFEARTQHRLSCIQLAELFSVDASTIAAWEAGPGINEDGRSGWAIPPAWQPLVQAWIETGIPPAPEASRKAKDMLGNTRRRRAKKGPREIPLRVRLRLKRLSLHMLQCELAAVFDVSPSIISRWECGLQVDAETVHGGEIHKAWQPLVERWIQTETAPTKKEIAAAQAASRVRHGGGSSDPTFQFETLAQQVRAMDPDPTIRQIVETYLCVWGPSVQPDTLKRARPRLLMFVDSFGERRVSECRTIDFTVWLKAKSANWKSAWTAYDMVKTIGCCFGWAIRQQLITRNPFRGIKQRQGPPRRAVTPEELQAMLRYTNPAARQSGKETPHQAARRLRDRGLKLPEIANALGVSRATVGRYLHARGWKSPRFASRPSPAARLRQLLVFLSRTGARPNEARQLKWSEIDWSIGCAVLTHHKTIGLQGNPQPRRIFFDDVVTKLLLWIQLHDPSSDYVFRTHRQRPWTPGATAQRIQRLRRKAGIANDAKLYGLRHSFGTRSVMMTSDIKATGDLMGHTTVRTTERYTHLPSEHLAAMVRRVNKASSPAAKKTAAGVPVMPAAGEARRRVS
jgi:transcriptional regulator with XRE-family HTH domain